MAKSSQSSEVKQTNLKINNASLNRWNRWLAGLHALQGLVVLLLATPKAFPVVTSYLTSDPIASDISDGPVLDIATAHVLDVNLAHLVAAFFFVSAIAHLVIATVYRSEYEADLKKKLNKLRWVEYAISASTMLVAIGLLTGIADLSTLLLIFVMTLIMSLTGLAMEVYNQGKAKPNWLAYAIGCIAGIVPWVVLGVYMWGTNVFGSGDIPTFVYWIYGSMFVLFSSFAFNMFLQYKQVGKWSNYLYGERSYMVLSLAAKTVLAWQVFAGALRP